MEDSGAGSTRNRRRARAALFESQAGVSTLDVIRDIQRRHDAEANGEITTTQTQTQTQTPSRRLVSVNLEFKDALNRVGLNNSDVFQPHMLKVQGPVRRGQSSLRKSRTFCPRSTYSSQGRDLLSQTIIHGDPLHASRLGSSDDDDMECHPGRSTLKPYLSFIEEAEKEKEKQEEEEEKEEKKLYGPLSLSSTAEEDMVNTKVVVAIPTEVIEMIPTECSSSGADLEYSLDLKDMLCYYDRIKFHTRKIDSAEKRFFSFTIKEMKEKSVSFLCTLMKALCFYVYPMKTGKTGLKKDLIDKLFEGVEDMFFGMLKIVNAMIKKRDCTIERDEPEKEVEKAFCGCELLRNGYVTYARHHDFRMSFVKYITEEKDVRYRTIKAFLEETALKLVHEGFDEEEEEDSKPTSENATAKPAPGNADVKTASGNIVIANPIVTNVVSKKKARVGRLLDLVDTLFQYLPKLDATFSNIEKYSTHLKFNRMRESYGNICRFYKSIISTANEIRSFGENEDKVRVIENCIASTPSRFSEGADALHIADLKNHHIVDFVNQESKYGFIILLYDDLLLLVNTVGSPVENPESDEETRIGMRITNWFNFDSYEFKVDSIRPVIYVTGPNGVNKTLVIFSDIFRNHIMHTYEEYKCYRRFLQNCQE